MHVHNSSTKRHSCVLTPDVSWTFGTRDRSMSHVTCHAAMVSAVTDTLTWTILRDCLPGLQIQETAKDALAKIS